MSDSLVLPSEPRARAAITKKVEEFLEKFRPYELSSGGKVFLFLDEKSGAHYLSCHLDGKVLANSCDSEASLDGDEEDEIYKLNREITEDEAAYKVMEQDAIKGRSFEDMVLEYDTKYRAKKPLKVYGGQHRLMAITKAIPPKTATLHGVRIYFELTREQKVEIATINNTAIAVPNDLLDRMKEQLLGTDLRDWCQTVGLLEKATDFSDKRSPDVPTVRAARTLILNFYLGRDAKEISDFHQPILCKSGGIDDEYMKIRSRIVWSDSALEKMGKQFARLHKTQRKTVSDREEDDNAEFARKALSLSVIASWGYAAGLFQRDANLLNHLYSIPDNVSPPDDPLNAKALSQARLKGTDPDTYRGLGTRSSPKELGRMLEVFWVLANKGKPRITKELANAAIQSYEAKKASHDAKAVLGKL
jgi:hypothetical protein